MLWRLQRAFGPGTADFYVHLVQIARAVVVIVGQRMILVTPEHEFDLGIVGPDERIVRELWGTKVIGATLAKASKASGI